MAGQWQNAQIIDLPRGYRAASGSYRGVRSGAVSTMIGAPSVDLLFTRASLRPPDEVRRI